MCWHTTATYSAQPTTPSIARARVATGLGAVLDAHAAADLLDDATLVVSELVTNAVQAGSEMVTLVLDLHHDELEIGVLDTADGHPELRHAAPTSNHGRGLALVDALTTSWGVRTVDGGKSVWARLAVPATLTDLLECQNRVA